MAPSAYQNIKRGRQFDPLFRRGKVIGVRR